MEREFLGIWIPKEIWVCPNISLLEKCLLAEIESLDIEGKGCCASNKYFAEFFGATETTISTSISHLKSLDLIEQVSFNGRSRVLKIKSLPLKNLKSAFKNLKPNNIDNNINNITITKSNNNIIEKNIKKSKMIDLGKVTKKSIFITKAKDTFKVYTLDEEILEKLEDWLLGQGELNKLPSEKGLAESLKELFRFSKTEILSAINKSIMGGYKTFYPEKIKDISADGINRNAESSKEKMEKTKEYLGVNSSATKIKGF